MGGENKNGRKNKFVAACVCVSHVDCGGIFASDLFLKTKEEFTFLSQARRRQRNQGTVSTDDDVFLQTIKQIHVFFFGVRA